MLLLYILALTRLSVDVEQPENPVVGVDNIGMSYQAVACALGYLLLSFWTDTLQVLFQVTWWHLKPNWPVSDVPAMFV